VKKIFIWPRFILFPSFLLLHLLGLFEGHTGRAFGSPFTGEFDFGHRAYATLESSQNLILNLGAESKTEVWQRPRYEALVYSDIEFATQNRLGKNFDLGTTAYRQGLGDYLLFSFGRFYPLEEFSEYYEKSSIDAVGINWSVNEKNPSLVRPVGWLGIGSRVRLYKNLTLGFQYSPLFIPTLGPTIVYSKDDAPSSESPFARLPPASVKLDAETQLPLRIALDEIDMRKLLLQDQFFAALNYTYPELFSLSLFAWDSPSPTPTTTTTEMLRVSGDDVYILVNATAAFPRRQRTGVALSSTFIDMQAVYEQAGGLLTLSSALKLYSYLQIGFLHTIRGAQNNDAGDSGEESGEIVSPLLDEKMAWISASLPLFYSLKLSGRLLKNMNVVNDGASLNLTAQYDFTSYASIYSTLQLFAGGDNSYFGTWRNLDFITTGVSARW